MHAPTLSISAAPLETGELQTNIHQAMSDRLTGLIHVNFHLGKTLTLVTQHGHIRQIYIRNHRVPDLNWELPLRMYGGGSIEIRPMPMQALVFRKVILEGLDHIQRQPTGTPQLKAAFDLAERNTFPTLFHIQWASAEGFVLVPGRNIPLRRAVMLTPSGVGEGPAALDQIAAWQEPQCHVMAHRGDIKNQAWLEVHLNILLEWYCHKILTQYGQLTGAVMVRSLLHSLSVLAEKNGWNISTQNQQLTDTSIFLDAAEAGHAYREILLAIRSRIEPIIGSSLTLNLMRQSVDSTRDIYKIIQEAFGLIGEVQQ